MQVQTPEDPRISSNGASFPEYSSRFYCIVLSRNSNLYARFSSKSTFISQTCGTRRAIIIEIYLQMQILKFAKSIKQKKGSSI